MKLVVYPDGRAMIHLPPDITDENVQAIQEAWREWATGPGAQLMLIPGEVELELQVGPVPTLVTVVREGA